MAQLPVPTFTEAMVHLKNSEKKRSSSLLSEEVDRAVRKVLKNEMLNQSDSAEYDESLTETLLLKMEKKSHEDFLRELVRQVKIGNIQPELKHVYKQMWRMLNRETIEKMVYVLNEDEDQVFKEKPTKGWKKLQKNWKEKDYEVHFSGKKTLAGKLIKHTYIYSHGGLNKKLVNGKAALANENGERCAGKELAEILRNDGYLKDNIKDKDLFFIDEDDQRPLITLMACGAGSSPGSKQVKLYTKVYGMTNGKRYQPKKKREIWQNNYPAKFRGPLPENDKVKPFVRDFWEEMQNLGLGYEQKIRRVHAFKAVVIPDRKRAYDPALAHVNAGLNDTLFGLMTYGLRDDGSKSSKIDLDLNSKTITVQMINDSKIGEYVTIVPEPSPVAVKQSLRLTDDPTSYTSRDQRTRNQNRIHRHQKYPTSNTIRGLRMIAEIQNEQLNSNNAYDINEVFWT